MKRVVESHLPIYSNFYVATVILKFPNPEAAQGRQTLVDAGVADEVLGVQWLRIVLDIRYVAPTTAKRMSGPIRAEIISLATCSPIRTPAS